MGFFYNFFLFFGFFAEFKSPEMNKSRLKELLFPFPLRKTALKINKSSVEFSKAINEHIAATKGKEACSMTATMFLNFLDEARKGFKFLLFEKQLNENAMKKEDFDKIENELLKYVKRLMVLDKRFRSIGGKKLNAVNISFQWTDTFMSKNITNSAFAYEIAAILVNYSRIAFGIGYNFLSATPKTKDTIREAVRHFKKAMWSMDLLMDYLPRSLGDTTLPGDVSPLALVLQKHLAKGAIAIAIFEITKLCGDEFSSEEITKCLKTGSFNFEVCQRLFEKNEENRHVNFKGNSMLRQSINFMFALSTSLCYFFKALEIEEKHRSDFELHIGEKLGHLNEAMAIIEKENQVLKNSKNFSKLLVPTDKEFLQILEKLLKEELDNDQNRNNQIYRVEVVSGLKLPRVQELDGGLFGASSPEEWTKKLHDEDAFDNFKPVELNNYYEELKIEIEMLKQEMLEPFEKFRFQMNEGLANTEISKFFSFDPNSLENKIVPKEIMDKREEFMKNGGVLKYTELIKSIGEGATVAKNLIQDMGKRLRDEAKGDQEMRSKYRENWRRIPSEELNQGWRKQLECNFQFPLTHPHFSSLHFI